MIKEGNIPPAEAPITFPDLYNAVDSIFQSPEYVQAIGKLMMDTDPNRRQEIREVTIKKNGYDWILPIRNHDGFRGFRRRLRTTIGGNDVYGQMDIGPAPIEVTVNEDIELREERGRTNIFWKREAWPIGNHAMDSELRRNSAWNDQQAAERISSMVTDFFAAEEEDVPFESEVVEVFASDKNLELVAGGEFLTPKQIRAVQAEANYRERTKDWPIWKHEQ